MRLPKPLSVRQWVYLMTTGFRQILVQVIWDETRTVSISIVVRQEKPARGLTKCIRRSRNEVWQTACYFFPLVGVWIPWRLYKANMLHSRGKGVSQGPTSSRAQQSACSAQPMESSILTPLTSCGHTQPAGVAEFWLSTGGWAGTECWDRVLPSSSTAGVPGTPALPWLGPRPPPHFASGELPLPLAPLSPLVITQVPFPRRPGCQAAVSPTGA